MEAAEHPLHNNVNWLLNRAWLGFGQHSSDALEAFGVSVKEHLMMVALMSSPMTQLELTALIKSDKSVVSSALDGLEAKGLVERVPDPRDRRVRRPTLTSAGRRTCRRATAAVEAAEKELLDRLEPDQRDVFLAVLRNYVFTELVDAPAFTHRPRK